MAKKKKETGFTWGAFGEDENRDQTGELLDEVCELVGEMCEEIAKLSKSTKSLITKVANVKKSVDYIQQYGIVDKSMRRVLMRKKLVTATEVLHDLRKNNNSSRDEKRIKAIDEYKDLRKPKG